MGAGLVTIEWLLLLLRVVTRQKMENKARKEKRLMTDDMLVNDEGVDEHWVSGIKSFARGTFSASVLTPSSSRLAI